MACPGGTVSDPSGSTQSSGSASACQKKVVEIGPNIYSCEKCQRRYDHCLHRYILSLALSDASGQYWAIAFNDVGELIIGKSAAELNEIKEMVTLNLSLGLRSKFQWIERNRV
jgi:Replication factor-A C terminal domain